MMVAGEDAFGEIADQVRNDGVGEIAELVCDDGVGKLRILSAMTEREYVRMTSNGNDRGGRRWGGAKTPSARLRIRSAMTEWE
jgi:hypothetical protein